MYEFFVTDRFEASAKGKYRSLYPRIQKKTALLLQDPYHACKSELLRGNKRGLRSAHFDQDLRYVYAICEECRKQGWQSFTGCPKDRCLALDEHTVVFIGFGNHKEVYE